MPPIVFRKMLTVIHLLVSLSFVMQPVAPLASAATFAAQDARPDSQEELPAEPTPEPIAEFPSEAEVSPFPPINGPLEPENPVDNTEPPVEAAEPVEMEMPPLVAEELAPQPTPGPIDEPGLDVPVHVTVDQDRYVMAMGETTYITLTVSPTFAQVPTTTQVILTPSSNLVSIIGAEGNSWSVPPLLEGEQFVRQLELQIATTELPPTGAVITFTVEARAPDFRAVSTVHWLGLLPANALPPAEPLTDSTEMTDTATVSAITSSQQSDQGAVLARADARGETEFLLLAAPGSVPAGTQFTYTDLTPGASPPPLAPAAPLQIENPLYLPSVKSDNAMAFASSEITTAAPVTTIDGADIYAMWHLTATQSDGSGVTDFDAPVLLMLSVDEWVAAGLDMEAVQLLTREDNSQPWQIEPSRYDEKRQVWVTQLSHFSEFALGEGLGSGLELLPSMTGFASGGYTGAATYNHPLEAPDGLGGMNPNLSLSYSSNVADNIIMHTDYNDSKIQGSVVGYGWELGGLSYIARVQLPNSPDEEYYTLVINGQRVDIVGAKTPATTGYRTNPELFALVKYAQTSSTSTWTVTMPDGMVYTFGGVRADANQNNAQVTMMAARTSTSAFAFKFDRWMLTQVQDPSGNYMSYTYRSERDNTSGTCSSISWYSNAIRLETVRWSGLVGVLPAKLQMDFIYAAGDRGDWDIQTSGTLCGQRKYTKKFLEKVEVRVWDAAGTTSYLIRSYQLAHAADSQPTDYSFKHQLLKSIVQRGNDGTTVLHTTTFNYQNYPDPDDQDYTVNNVRLSEVVTGYGAKVYYTYTRHSIVDCAAGGVNHDFCFDAFWPVTKVKVFSGITDPNGNDGPYSWTETRYTYPSGSRYFVHTGTYGNIGEWLGVGSSTETTYEGTDSSATTGAVIRYLYTEYYRFYPSTSNPDPRKGKIYRQELYNASGGALYYRSNHTWNFLIQYPPATLGDTGWAVPTSAPQINHVAWVRQDIKDEWTSGVGKRTAYSYSKSNQNNTQYGNVTHIDEYSHDIPGNPDTVQSATDLTDPGIHAIADIPYAEWQSRLINSQITLKRRTIIEYFPEGVDEDNYYVVNRPARKSVGIVSASTFTCYSDTRYIYDQTGPNYLVSPTLGRLIRSQTALKSCYDGGSVLDTNTNWAISIYGYDIWGNQTSVTTKGSFDQVLETTYDPVYKLFPIKQHLNRTQFTSFEYAETAEYYGVNLASTNPAENWGGSRFAWGKLAEHCGVNGVCTFQSYDVHGRPVRRWEHLDSTSQMANANAKIYWSYRMPDATLPTYRVTEWRSPRCAGNFVRRHYNGLGQLYMEQTPDQDWEHIVDNCGAENDKGREIRVNYAYNGLGKVLHQSVPQLIARSDSMLYDIDWNTLVKRTNSYDPLGRVLVSIAFNGETTHIGYGGRITSVNAKGRNGEADHHRSWQMVDGLGYPRLLRVYENSGGVWNARSQVMLTADVMGNITQVVLPGGIGTTTMTYNLAGQKTSQSDSPTAPDMGNWSYAYNRQGNLIYQIDGRGQRSCFYDDTLGRIIGKLAVNNNSCPASSGGTPPTNVVQRVVFGYDYLGTSTYPGNRGQLTAVESRTYANSAETEFTYRQDLTYNTKGFLVNDKMTIGDTNHSWTTSFAYDGFHRLFRVTYPDGSRVRTGYNSMGLPAWLCDVDATNACIGANLVDNVNYDVAGRITSMNLPASAGFSREYEYYDWSSTDGNSNGRLEAMRVKENGSNRLVRRYWYDSFGNIINIRDQNATDYPMAYDYRNRLTSAYGLTNSWDQGKTRPTRIENNDFIYDSRPMAPTAVGGHAFQWDGNGNMIVRDFKTVQDIERRQYLTWDEENHLEKVTGYGYNGNLLTEEYRYTTDGTRIRKAVNGSLTYYPSRYYLDTNSGFSIRSYFFGNMRIAERQGSGSTPVIYRHGDQVDSTIYTHYNSHKTGRHYTAYGDNRGGLVDTYYTYAGQYEDGTGLVYMKARYYDPNIGLFISPDTIIPDPSNVLDYNRYLYARGNPVSNNDPTGHRSNLCCVTGLPNALIMKVNQATKSFVESPEVQAMADAFGFVWCSMTACTLPDMIQEGHSYVRENYVDPHLPESYLEAETAINTILSDPLMQELLMGSVQMPLPGMGLGKGALGRLPIRPGNKGPTTGILVIEGVEYPPLVSGMDGVASQIPKGTPGFDIITRGHVEGHAAAIMRQQGAESATLYINNQPCPVCDNYLPRMLPEGSSLQIIGPDGFNQTYIGLPD